jgi:polysaccharide biosynthesis/export protein
MVKNILILLSIFYILSSCKVYTSTDMFRTDTKFAYDPVNNKVKEILIQPGDILSIQMITNEGLSLLEGGMTGGQGGAMNSASVANSTNNTNSYYGYLVEFDSLVKIPSLGRIKLGGYTIREAEAFLENKFAENYQKPYVKLRILNRKVTMFLEQATKATIIPLTEVNMTLVDAIAHVGGVPENSKSYIIKVIRGDRLNPKVFNFSVRTLSDFKNNNLLLEANDIVYIASRPRYVFKSINEIQPYLMLCSTTILLFSFYNQYMK